MRRVSWLCALLAIGGCRCGTVSQEELEASYEIMPNERASVLAKTILDAIEPPFRVMELTVRSETAAAEVVSPRQPDRVLAYRYDGWTVDETGFEALEAGLDAQSAGFSLDEVPLARLDELVGRARAAIDRPIATFSMLRVVRDGSEPLEIHVSFRSFREGSANVVFDAAGNVVRVHQ